MAEQLLEHLDDVIVGMEIVVQEDTMIQRLQLLFRLLLQFGRSDGLGRHHRGSVHCSASICDLTRSRQHLIRWIKAWGRNGFDGIESLWEGVPGSELP